MFLDLAPCSAWSGHPPETPSHPLLGWEGYYYTCFLYNCMRMNKSGSRAMSSYQMLMTVEQNEKLKSDHQWMTDYHEGTPLHTTWYITGQGDRVWLRFDSSMSSYTGTR